ncbi:MAG: class I SAM-dependent methyltransferase [Alphaproteobacteria bacterium]|nr:class I SAM-dependent methyltransferase [Alphaproteobacteria bacterium]
MAEYNELYARASLYDIALGRDVSREIAFVQEAFRTLAGRPLGSILEIACGPGYHTRGFARLGVNATGLDLRPEMVAFARELARKNGVAAAWIAADMRDFRLPEPVDAIITMYDALDYLADQDDVIAHFRNVAANLKPDGVYILEFTHPHDTGFADYGSFRYEGVRDGVRVVIEWANNNPAYEPDTLVADVEVTLRVTEKGREQVFVDRARERMFTAPEIRALARLSGALRVVRTWGDFRLDRPLDSGPPPRKMILALRP